MRPRTIAVGLLAATFALAAPGLAAAACQQWTGAEPVSPGTNHNRLMGVVVLGPCNAYAVGAFDNGGSGLPLMERYNGNAWRQVTIPTPGTSSKLEDVSPSWAVGSTSDPFFKTFILRRIGSSWAQITSPSPSGSLNELYGVVQLGPDNAWAVGDLEGPSAQRTLILHWNGTTWKRIASPNAGDASTPNILLDVDAVSAHDIWAVGTSGNSFPNKTLTLHWNGSKWKRVPSPNFDAATFGDSLIDVAAVASDNVWAVGNTSVGSASEALVLHWNGSKWKRSSLPAGDHSILQGATAFGAKNVWAVGETGLGNLVLHWNGRAWKKISVANPGTLENGLNAIGGSSPGNFWAVGQSRDEGPTPYQARAMHCC